MQIDEYRCVKHVWSVSCAWQRMHVGVLLWLTISQSQLLNRLAWFFYLQMFLFTVWEEWPWMRPAAFASYNKTDLTFELSCKLCKVWYFFSAAFSLERLVRCKTECGNKVDDALRSAKYPSRIVQICVFLHCLQAFKPWKPQVIVCFL